MQTIELAGSGRTTTRLGFGCSALMGSLGKRDSLRLLGAAYEAGFRHFDVAPMYGYGESEACLGEFAAAHPDITLTTKFGIAPARNSGLLSVARRVAGPLVKQIPGLKKRLAGAAASVAAPAARPSFTVPQARASLERSLALLRRERVDVWLLHEAEADDLRDDALLRFLEDAMAQGKVGTFGVGSDGAKMEPLLRERAGYCRVLQYEWSVFDASVAPGGPFRIHHRALTDGFRHLYAALSAEPATAARWSDEVGADVHDREVLASLMLKASLVMNPESVVLVSSKAPAHLRENARIVDDAGLAAGARRLHAVVLREGKALLERTVAA